MLKLFKVMRRNFSQHTKNGELVQVQGQKEIWLGKEFF